MLLWLTHVDVWQKPTQYSKAIILQFKKRKNKKTQHVKQYHIATTLKFGEIRDQKFSRNKKLGVLQIHTHTGVPSCKPLLSSFRSSSGPHSIKALPTHPSKVFTWFLDVMPHIAIMLEHCKLC